MNQKDPETKFRGLFCTARVNEFQNGKTDCLAICFLREYNRINGRSFDEVGNLASYTENETTTSYTYDDQGQLLTATDGTTTYTYTYDTVGNILTASNGTATNTYTYANDQWRDLLTAFDGQAIAYQGQIYDAETNTVTGTAVSGNPVSYYNGTRWSFGWTNGRQLVSADSTGTEVDFTYSADGLRMTKTVGGVTHTYYYAGGKLLRETYGDTTLDFFYDANGNPFALKVDDTVYYYITNLQGDVLRLVDADGSTVAAYTYDPYGKVLTATGTLANTNPLRYRGYYFDTETGFYYLQSRYYDPTICRFINADGYASTGQGIVGHNMFAYCGNCPSLRIDDRGNSWTSVLGEYISNLIDQAQDEMWKVGSQLAEELGYNLSFDLFKLAASGSNQKYIASNGDYAAQLIKSDVTFINKLRTDYYIDGHTIAYTSSHTFSVSKGDLGAALHRVEYSYFPINNKITKQTFLAVQVTDTFDFTEFKNPFTQGSIKSGALWLLNDIAYIGTELGLLYPIDVEISFVIPIYPE